MKIVCLNKTSNKQDYKKKTGNYYDYCFTLMLHNLKCK